MRLRSSPYCPIHGLHAHPREPRLLHRRYRTFQRVRSGAGLIICNNKVLRPIRRFCFRRSRPCYPNSFGTGSHPPRKISASAFAPEPECIGNVDVAVASTARTTWQSLQTRLTVRPPCGASSQFSARALPGLDQSHCCHRPTEPRRGADPRRATPLSLANELFSKSLHQIMRRRDRAYI